MFPFTFIWKSELRSLRADRAEARRSIAAAHSIENVRAALSQLQKAIEPDDPIQVHLTTARARADEMAELMPVPRAVSQRYVMPPGHPMREAV